MLNLLISSTLILFRHLVGLSLAESNIQVHSKDCDLNYGISIGNIEVKPGKKAINWDVLVVYACSVSIGNALIAFIMICAFTNVLTEFLSNPICAAVIAPIGAQVAMDMGANPVTFCIGILIAVASCFATPIGSVTNLVVHTPGGYKFTDFTRIGIPINLAVLVTNIVGTLLVFPL